MLVPQVYVKVQSGDLAGSGALLAGKDVNLTIAVMVVTCFANAKKKSPF